MRRIQQISKHFCKISAFVVDNFIGISTVTAEIPQYMLVYNVGGGVAGSGRLVLKTGGN